jgi:hypothetical protein
MRLQEPWKIKIIQIARLQQQQQQQRQKQSSERGEEIYRGHGLCGLNY